MSYDGLPARADGAREAVTDRPARAHRPGHFARMTAIGALATLAFVGCGNTATSSGAVAGASGTPAASIDTGGASPSVEVSPSASAATQALLAFQEANESGIFGGGSITDLGEGASAVTLGVVAVGFTDALPAEIVAGDCATIIAAPAPSVAPAASAGASAGTDASPAASAATGSPDASAGAAGSPEPSVAPTPATLPVQLTDVTAGSSNTSIQMPLSELLASPSAVVIHRSAADPTVVACADITDQPLPVPSNLPSALPSGIALPSDLPSLPALPSASP